MEERFIKIGDEFAARLSKEHNIENSDALKLFCREYKWNWFRAECSDDYSRTLEEQDKLNRRLEQWIASETG
jgi:hypothetical protein